MGIAAVCRVPEPRRNALFPCLDPCAKSIRAQHLLLLQVVANLGHQLSGQCILQNWGQSPKLGSQNWQNWGQSLLSTSTIHLKCTLTLSRTPISIEGRKP